MYFGWDPGPNRYSIKESSTNMKTFLKNNIKSIGIIVLMLVGLSLLVYPLVANSWNTYVQSTLVSNYAEAVDKAVEAGTLDVGAELNRAYDYNDALLPSILPDSFAEAEANGSSSEYMQCLNANGDGVMGYVQIPKINVTLPIFHTTSEEVLEKGVGHLEGSSLPVGGESTHSVLSAHRGLPSSALFTDLDMLEIGDDFFIKIMDEYIAYEVDQILVTEPDDTSALTVDAGQDYCTLLTCTPYGVNTQRLMVRGHRVAYTPELLADAQVPTTGQISLHTSYGLWVVIGLAIVAAFILLLYLYDKKKRGSFTSEEKNS